MLNSFLDKFIFTNTLSYKHHNFFLATLPFVIIPTDFVAHIIRADNPGLNVELYYSIKGGVLMSLKKEFAAEFGISGEKGLEFLETFFSACGWGDLQRKQLDPDKKHAIVSVENSPMPPRCPKAKFPVDLLTRAYLAVIYSVYFRSPVECVEAQCAISGSNTCEFVIKPLEDFNFENKVTRMQLKVE